MSEADSNQVVIEVFAKLSSLGDILIRYSEATLNQLAVSGMVGSASTIYREHVS